MISLEQVSFGYGENQETLSQVSATVARGECVLLCGASGCGKTTVTKLINGLIPAFTPGCRLGGRVMVDGLVPRETPMYELAQRVGSVFQNPKSQFFNLDTDSELAFGLENEGRPPEEICRRVERAVETLHLQALRGKNIFSLSGGQKQLLAFGSVYAMGPEIYVLDEPTANLDQEAIARLRHQIAALKQQGCTIVVAEHRLYFLTDLIDRALY
ncbi:MAG: ABC transporter ATP-binding protein, partial [Clostridiales bacterium]|nr:ABC transporter ATP-binding protein [Clostridiales bacterium]